MIIFYDHLFDKSEILQIIELSEDAPNHKGKIRQLVDDILHHGILEVILEKLHPSKHKTFLILVEERPYDPEILEYLREHIGHGVEDLITERANQLLTEIRQDLLED